MSSNHLERTVLFVDIVGSTQLYSDLGDDRAYEVIHEAMDVLQDVVCQSMGVVIKTMGDGMMATFETPEEATKAALFMVNLFKETAPIEGLQPGTIKITLGFHHGEVVAEENDVFGNAVNLAARVVAKAKSFQILLPKETLDLLDAEELNFQPRFVEALLLKGFDEKIEVYEIFQAEDDANITQCSVDGEFVEPVTKFLKLQFQNQSFELNNDFKSLSIGREEKNHLSVQGDKVSRTHATIENKQSKFVLVDKSTNGTYIVFDDGNQQFVHIDDFPLLGSGWIGLGKIPEPNSPEAIRFEIKSSL